MPTVLVVEDDANLRRAIGLGLRRSGYDVQECESGEEAFGLHERVRPDVIVLDILLPHIRGLDVCRRLRKSDTEVPILFISALGEVADRIAGLKIGADDYLAKPFDLDELLARIEVQLRRRAQKGTPMSPARYGPLVIDFDRMQATRDDEAVSLTAREFGVLAYLAKHRDRIVTREELLQHVCKSEPDIDTRAIDTHIANLRSKLKDNVKRPLIIASVWGQGYRFIA